MNTNKDRAGQNKERLAQPADEEIKLHGDQLAKEVKVAAGGKSDKNLQSNKKIDSGNKSP